MLSDVEEGNNLSGVKEADSIKELNKSLMGAM